MTYTSFGGSSRWKKHLFVAMAADTSCVEVQDVTMEESTPAKDQTGQKMFTLKKWNAVAMWSWDVECDTCAICRVQVMGTSNVTKYFLKCYYDEIPVFPI